MKEFFKKLFGKEEHKPVNVGKAIIKFYMSDGITCIEHIKKGKVIDSFRDSQVICRVDSDSVEKYIENISKTGFIKNDDDDRYYPVNEIKAIEVKYEEFMV